MNAAKQRLYALVDSLPEQQLGAAERYLQSLQAHAAKNNAQEVPETLSLHDEEAVLAGLAELDRGESISAEQAYEELRAKYAPQR